MKLRYLPILAFLALIILGLATGLPFLYFTFCRRGSWCRVTPVLIEVEQKAQVKMEFKLEHSSGAYRTQTVTVDGVIQTSGHWSGGSSSRFFFPRPVKGGFTTGFDMDLEPDNGERSLKERATEAIRVRTGETYLVTPDEQLLLYRFKDSEVHLLGDGLQVREGDPGDLSPMDEEIRPKKRP